MSARRLPVRPDLAQLKRQAKELRNDLRRGDADALALAQQHAPSFTKYADCTLADAQFILARSYEAPSWTRLVQAVQLANAIWDDDATIVRTLITRNRTLLTERVLIRASSHWGPPLTYAANLGRDRLIVMLRSLGATDFESALDRAALQGQIGTARLLHEWLGQPMPPDDALGGAAYTLNVEGTRFLLDAGARVVDDTGALLAPVDVVLQTDSRRPDDKHAILAMYEERGVRYPDTPTMAMHRGRIDLLEALVARDASMLHRTYSHRELYPAEMRCGAESDATEGTPLGGSTLLHMCIDFGELEMARWLVAHGANVNARSHVGASGFGGHTPLFNTVVCQTNFWVNAQQQGPFDAPFTQLLLEHGADVNVRASLWKQLHQGYGESPRVDYHDVTALSWGRRFHSKVFVSEPAMRLIEDAGGVE